MPSGSQSDALQIGEWVVNPALDTISRCNETQKLEPKTMRLLMCLAASPGEVISVERLLDEVWSGVVVGSASVYQAISQLRKLLGDIDPNPTYIATVPRKGYRLIAAVHPVQSELLMMAAGDVVIAPISEAALAPVSEAVVALEAANGSVPRRTTAVLAAASVLVALLAGVALIWRSSALHRMAATASSIVVLPFMDMTMEKTGQPFCDGLTEELSNWVAQIPTLRVVARTSAFAFQGKDQDVRSIGKALDTDHILEGSMRQSGDHMRITVQLIDAHTGYHMWSENFDRPLDDAIKIQEDVSRSVAEVLKVRLTSDSERQWAARHTGDPQAYQLYLVARHYQQQQTPESTDRAIELYRQVLLADPKFAPAYVQLGYARLNQGYFRVRPISEVVADVEPLIAAVLQIDDRLSGAYGVRGALRADQGKVEEALEDLQKAIAMNPSDMSSIARIGKIRLFDGQPREALQNYDRAAALDPLNSVLQVQRCVVLGDLARYDEAQSACKQAQVLKGDGALAPDTLAWLAESRGRLDEALHWNANAIKAAPDDDFDTYWTRATFWLYLGNASRARAAVNLGRNATQDEVAAKAAMVRVAYCEGGEQSLRSYMASVDLDGSTNAVSLFEAAYAHLLLQEPAAAKELISRALVAPDRVPGFAEIPWYARGARAVGVSYRVDLAVAETALGERQQAKQELDTTLAMVNKMIAAGVERYATYELRAKVYALRGQSDDAMRDLTTAVQLGWRRSWWAAREPYFNSLRTRSDFQSLLAQVDRSNEQLIEKIDRDPSDISAGTRR